MTLNEAHENCQTGQYLLLWFCSPKLSNGQWTPRTLKKTTFGIGYLVRVFDLSSAERVLDISPVEVVDVQLWRFSNFAFVDSGTFPLE